MIESVSGGSWPVFFGLTVILFGGCAFLAGQAAATAWRSPGWVAAQALMLGMGDRFLSYALFDGPLWSAAGMVAHTGVLLGIGFVAYRLTLVRRMCRQYPWLYRRIGPFRWAPISGGVTNRMA